MIDMTEEEALEELCIRACNINLFFSEPPNIPWVKTRGGDHLDEFTLFFGGKADEDTLTTNPRYYGERCWMCHHDAAIELTKKLLLRKTFWKSGKFSYAQKMVDYYEGNTNELSHTKAVKRY
jgi:hypothetical protein